MPLRPKTHDVTTPDGFKEAYKQFAEAGWASLDARLSLADRDCHTP